MLPALNDIHLLTIMVDRLIILYYNKSSSMNFSWFLTRLRSLSDKSL